MKTLAEVKNEVAEGFGFKDWNSLYWNASNVQLSEAIDVLAIRYAKATLLHMIQKEELN